MPPHLIEELAEGVDEEVPRHPHEHIGQLEEGPGELPLLLVGEKEGALGSLGLQGLVTDTPCNGVYF